MVAALAADAPGRTRARSPSVDGAAAGFRVARRSTGRVLVAADGTELVAVDDLADDAPHDLANALAAAALALEVGGNRAGCVDAALRGFSAAAHRLQLVATIDGVRYVDDSKATNVHAALAAVRGFAAGRAHRRRAQQGSRPLGRSRAAGDHVVAVVAIGDAADEVEAAFRGVVPGHASRRRCATPCAPRVVRRVRGDVVLLSPACASFDWYRSYAERGDDFAREVVAEARR